MERFLALEGGYLIVLLIILFVIFLLILLIRFLLILIGINKRPIFKKSLISKILLVVGTVGVVFIGLHHKIAIDRMIEVKNAFKEGKTIVCEYGVDLLTEHKVESMNISKKTNEWSIKGDIFVSPNYSHAFHTTRCLVK